MAEKKKFQSWIEPTRNFLKTAFSIQKTISGKSFEGIRQIVEKIGTNRLISEKIASWDFAPPFDFAAQFLASRAARRGGRTSPSAFKKLAKSCFVGIEGLEPSTSATCPVRFLWWAL